MRDENVNSYICPLENGYVIRVHILAPHTFRIQFRDHDFGEDSALVRYGILNMEAQENSKHTFYTLTDTYVIETSEARLSINKADGQLSLTKPDHSVLLENKIAPWNTKSEGFGTVFLLQEGN